MPKLDIVAGIIDKVAGHVDKFTLDKQEKAELITEINKAQMEVNKVEAGHTSMFVAGWRPFTQKLNSALCCDTRKLNIRSCWARLAVSMQ